MTATDQALESNEQYAKNFTSSDLHAPPARKLAIVTCMDARLMPDQILGLGIGDAHIIRNAGGIVTEDALRSLVISHHLLGAQEFIIINHTDCGLLAFKDEDLREKLESETGVSTVSPVTFHTFDDLESNVRRQVQKVQSHPWIPDSVSVRGFIYDVETGRLAEVPSDPQKND